MKMFRTNQVNLSPEIIFYLELEAKRMVAHTDATMTIDGVAEGIIRNELTTRNPDWVLAWSLKLQLKELTAAKHKEIEQRALGIK